MSLADFIRKRPVTLFLDTETFGTEFEAGVYRYAETGARPILISTRLSFGPSQHGRVLVEEWDDKSAFRLQAAVEAVDRVVIHNDEFDCTVLQANGVKIPVHKRYCTMRQARRHGLPGGLDKLCEIFKLPQDVAKLKTGRELMRLFCKPQKDGSIFDKTTHPLQWEAFKEYAAHDVLPMTELYYRMPHWNDAIEEEITRLDIEINTRGFQVDVELAEGMVEALESTKVQAAKDCEDWSLGEVERGTQRDRMLQHILKAHGVELPDLKAATLERRLKDESLPVAVRELLAIRLEAARVSTSKYSTLLRSVNKDGRLRGVKVYCGAARTGRFAAQRFQSDNMPRPSMPHEEIFRVIRAVKSGAFALVGEAPLNRCGAEALRGTVIAAPGHRLLVADLSNIEGRVVDWLADESDSLTAFRAYDAGVGPDLYRVSYGGAFGVAAEAVSGLQRQIGKVMELFLRYGGGVGAFVTGANTYKIDLEEMAKTAWPVIPKKIQLDAHRAYNRAVLDADPLAQALSSNVWLTCWALTRVWRAKHPKCVNLWYELEHCAKLTSVDGRTRTTGRLEFSKESNWLRMRLPSGRYLCYPSPKIQQNILHFWGVDPYKKVWRYQSLWGGTLLENAAQAVARDILCDGMLAASEDGGRIVLHIHDEIILEQPDGDGWTQEQLVECMTREYEWNRGLPLAAKGFETRRYYKEL